VEPAVLRVLQARPEVELWLGGLVAPTAALDPVADRLRRLPFVEWTALPELLRDVDVNLAPLAPGSRFNEAKSAIKWLEAALTATPTIASPTEAFGEAIETGRNGFLAGTADEWAAALRSLCFDPAQRARLGHRARRDALLSWSPHLQGRRYLEILEEEWPERAVPPPTGSGWEPVSHDEPFAPVTLEAYGEERADHLVEAEPPAAVEAPASTDPAGAARRRFRRARTLAGQGARSIEQDGIRVTGVRALQFARRCWPRAETRLRRAASAARARIDAARRHNHP
ncbi:MAG TPA: glycosyltransferase family 4 protein, partial [Acidimicrobiales bacterium]|nr:glycosyltransferase family 4 protein [Acidimicrobiales bacterium]